MYYCVDTVDGHSKTSGELHGWELGVTIGSAVTVALIIIIIKLLLLCYIRKRRKNGKLIITLILMCYM